MTQSFRSLQLLLFTGTILMALLMRWQGAPLSNAPESPAGIVSFELARTAAEAAAIRNAWGETEEAPLMQVAIHNTRLDFAFILFYMLFLYAAATAGTTQLPAFFSRMAPFAGILALKAGLMDVVENAFMLYQLQHRITTFTAMATHIAAVIKFGLILLVALWVLITSLIRLLSGRTIRPE